MNESDPLNRLRNTLKSLKGKGQTVVPIADVQRELDAAGGNSIETWKEDRLRDRLQYETEVQFVIEGSKAAVAAGQAALKSAILINGGAAVACLAFLGSLVQRGTPIQGFRCVLICFAVGTLLSAMGSGGTYLAQCCVGKDKARSHKWWNRAAVSCVILSYVVFLLGCLTAYISFR
jgi:hypothetical protein